MPISQDGKFRNFEVPFAQISKVLLRDKSLSWKAKGIYSDIVGLLSTPNFTLYKSFLIEESTDGIRSFNSGWDELKEKGYLKQYRIRTENGFRYEYELLKEPDTNIPATINVKMDGTISTPENKKNSFIKNSLDIEVEDDFKQTNEEKSISHKNSVNEITEKIKKQIDYEHWKAQDNPYIDNILNTMIDVYFSSNHFIKIGKEKKDINLVKSQFSKIKRAEIEDVILAIDDYIEQGNSIANPHAFLITALYNAPLTANINIKQYLGLSPGSKNDL